MSLTLSDQLIVSLYSSMYADKVFCSVISMLNLYLLQRVAEHDEPVPDVAGGGGPPRLHGGHALRSHGHLQR